jgi:putative transposase
MKKRKQKQQSLYNARMNKKNGTDNKPKEIEENFCYIPESKTIMIHPTSKQRKIINDWIASTRKVWNVCLNHINTNKDFIVSDVALRDKFVIKKNMSVDILNKMEWTLRTPKRIREYAVKDLVSCFNGGFTRLKKKQIRIFKIKSKYRKETKQTISLPHESSKIIDNKLRVCSLDLKLKEKMEDQEITSNMRLTRSGYNYYVHIPSFRKEARVQKESNNNTVGIDPGENIPLTYYSPNGEYGFIGSSLKSFLLEKYKKIKLLRERIKNKSILLRAIKKQENKIKNIVDDFQWKTCHWLLKKYNKIIIPSLYVRRCSNERKQLQNDMRHCTFVNRLIYKSCEYKNVEIHHCKEHYTSMTCTNCGSLKTKKDITVKCSVCDFEIHRDLSGARNMVIKHLSI